MAVADFEPAPSFGKLSSDAETLVLHCRRTPKVIRSVRDWAPSIYLVGFKLLSRADPNELIRVAELACRNNRADLTVANDLQNLAQAGTPSTWSGPVSAPRRSARVTTWPRGWSTASWPGPLRPVLPAAFLRLSE